MTSNSLIFVLADEERLRRGLPSSGGRAVAFFGSFLVPANDDLCRSSCPYLSAFARAHGADGHPWTEGAARRSVDRFLKFASAGGRSRLSRDVGDFLERARFDGDFASSVLGEGVAVREAVAFVAAVQRALACADATNFDEGDPT